MPDKRPDDAAELRRGIHPSRVSSLRRGDAMGLFDWIKKEGAAEARSQIFQIGVHTAWPLVVAAMTFLSGFIPGATAVPIPYLIWWTALTFIASSDGAYYFNRLLFQENPR